MDIKKAKEMLKAKPSGRKKPNKKETTRKCLSTIINSQVSIT